MDERVVELSDVIAVARRNVVGVVLSFLVCLLIAVVAAKELPRKYKSTGVLSIQSSYFRNPLVSDLVSEVTDTTELNSQRQSMLRLALSDDFVDELATRYSIYENAGDPDQRSIERERFLKKIQYFAVTPTSFQISVGGKDPVMAYQMTRDVLAQMTFTLIEERYRKLLHARDAIQSQAKFLSRALRDLGNPYHSEYLGRELERLNENIKSLKGRYTTDHPVLADLLSRARSIRARLRDTQSGEDPSPQDDVSKSFLVPGSKQPVQDIFNDLLKKLSHLNIVLEMERDRGGVSYLAVIEQPRIPTRAYFPDLLQFLVYGAAAGVILSIVHVIYSELKRSEMVAPEAASDTLGVPLLGELPALLGTSSELLLDGPRGMARALPAP
jgi:hypothetical protein